MSHYFKDNKFVKCILLFIIILLLFAYRLNQRNITTIPLFILDDVQYGVLEKADTKYNAEKDYLYLGSIEREVPFYFTLENNLDGFKLPVGTKIYITDKFLGVDEYRLFVVLEDTVYCCYPNISNNKSYDKYLK